MPGAARRHHFVPAFLLARFTASGEKTGELWVTDFETGKQFVRTPLTTGFQNDFHTVTAEGVAPDFLETEILAKIEARVAPTIKLVLENRTIPTGGAYTDLMYFISLMMVKTPRARGVSNYSVDWLNKLMLRQALLTEERWNELKASMREDKMGIDDDVSYEKMKKSVDEDRFTVTVDQNWTLAAMMEGAEAVLSCLVDRKWSLLTSTDGGFISSDYPATCSFVKPFPAMWSPAPCVPYTEVQFAMSDEVTLIGSLDAPSDSLELKLEQVAFYNSRTLTHVDRFVYSTRKEFLWLDRDWNMKNRPDEIVASRSR